MNQQQFFETLPISQTLDSLFRKGPSHFTKAANQLQESHRSADDAGNKLKAFLGRANRRYPQNIGPHPDYEHLKIDQSERGHVTTLFVDIKSSTKLGFKHPPETVRKIKNALIESAIVIFQAFDGHIHRLQGDAVVAFFRRKDLADTVTALDSLNAATSLMALLESFINPRFEAEGLDPIKIRIGIDHDPNALWGPYGIRNCVENTATGPYVDLAAKLQGSAGTNQIMIGDNVKNLLDLPDEFLLVKTYMKDGELKYDRYIYVDENYRMWVFNWNKYGDECEWLSRKEDGKLYIEQVPQNRWVPLQATLFDGNGREVGPLKSSSLIVPKGYRIEFSLLKGLMSGIVDDVEWHVENRGEEAEEEDALSYEIENSRGKYSASRDTRYLGHHYLICKVRYRHAGLKEKRFGVWIAPASHNALPPPRETLSLPLGSHSPAH